MENWFLIALIAPILWSIVNHIDKYILSRYQDGRGIGSILIFSSLFSVFVLPFIAFFHHSEIFNIPFGNFFMLIFIGFLGALAFYFYLKAMDVEEASVVVPLFQFDPVFGYFLSYFILGESLNVFQILSSVLILVGIIVLSMEIDIENRFRLKKRVLFLVAISSFLFALSGVLFKKLAIADSFWIAIFWQYVGLTLFGVSILIFNKKMKQNFVDMFRNPQLKIFSLNVISELFYIIGGIANNFAIVIAPVTLVFVVNSYQPFFVFIAGVFLTLFLPKFVLEKISTKHFFHKLFSIIIILVGSYLLYLSSNIIH